MLLKFNRKLYGKTMTTSLQNISKKYSNIEVQFLDICDIHLGDDLQLSYQDKADILLGILSSLLDKLPDNLSNTDLDNFKHLGTSLRSFHAKLG